MDGHSLHEAIESCGAVVVAEVGPWGSGAAGDDVRIDDDPVAALADKYRADSIGARTPIDSLRRLLQSMLDEVDAVVVSLPRTTRCSVGTIRRCATCCRRVGIPRLCLALIMQTPTPADHAALDAMAAASRMQEARHG